MTLNIKTPFGTGGVVTMPGTGAVTVDGKNVRDAGQVQLAGGNHKRVADPATFYHLMPMGYCALNTYQNHEYTAIMKQLCSISLCQTSLVGIVTKLAKKVTSAAFSVTPWPVLGKCKPPTQGSRSVLCASGSSPAHHYLL